MCKEAEFRALLEKEDKPLNEPQILTKQTLTREQTTAAHVAPALTNFMLFAVAVNLLDGNKTQQKSQEK